MAPDRRRSQRLRAPLCDHSAAFGCPFEGEVDPDVVARLAGEAYDGGRWRSPWPTRSASACRPRFGGCSSECARSPPGIRLRAHFHNTRNTGYANAFAAVDAGVARLEHRRLRWLPVRPNAIGNVATEDLVYRLHRSGIHTGVDTDLVTETAEWLGGLLDKEPPALLGRAGPFPPSALSARPVVDASNEGARRD